ncbi:MAG: hypothetical protein WKF73_04290 [Nocardioidaceae bacterium]
MKPALGIQHRRRAQRRHLFTKCRLVQELGASVGQALEYVKGVVAEPEDADVRVEHRLRLSQRATA